MFVKLEGGRGHHTNRSTPGPWRDFKQSHGRKGSLMKRVYICGGIWKQTDDYLTVQTWRQNAEHLWMKKESRIHKARGKRA